MMGVRDSNSANCFISRAAMYDLYPRQSVPSGTTAGFIRDWILQYGPHVSKEMASAASDHDEPLILCRAFQAVLGIVLAPRVSASYIMNLFLSKRPLHLVSALTVGAYSEHGVQLQSIYRDN